MEVPMQELRKEDQIDPKYSDTKIQIGSTLKLLTHISANLDWFTWSHKDMTCIDIGIIAQQLEVNPKAKPSKLKRRKFTSERNQIINEEVQNLMKSCMIRYVEYLEWLANVVAVRIKKNWKWQVCVNYSDLNKYCSKYLFHLSHINTMVDATTGHELLSFIDAFSGSNQIKINLVDQEKIAFTTEREIYCYNVLSFELKNDSATYQCLVNQMFVDQIEKTMEVYIHNMLIKSLKVEQHIKDL